MSQSAEEHRRNAPTALRCAVVTVSDTRTLETDTGGQDVVRLLEEAGHTIAARDIVRDEPGQIGSLVRELCRRDGVDAVLVTGGTGIASRDQTYETLSGLMTKIIPGYGELFRMLSFEEIGAAAMLSRAVGGLVGQTVLLTMPGSPAGVRLAMQRLIVPELPHLVREARR